MRSRTALFLRAPAVLGAALVAVLAVAAPATAGVPTAPAEAAPGTALAVTPNLAGTIALNNCSASLVRFPTSVDTDRAMMLTNGHCYEGGFINAGVVLLDRASTRSGSLLNSSGTAVATVRADRLMYATMTNTDVSLYRLNQTIGTIRTNTGISPLTISASHPVDGSSMFIASGFFARIWNCTINGFVPTLREDQWTWHDSIRYNTGCNTIHGTSGSPIVDTNSGLQVGINNTGNDNGQQCTLNNPCEVAADGTITVTQGQSYGQETYWFNTCLSSTRTIDLTVPGCLLTGATGGGGTTVYSDTFETATGWTANPNGTDTATTGQWVRGDPAATSSGVTLQLGTTVSGSNDLVTGAAAGSTAGDFDVDGGSTTIQSPAIALPTGTLTLSFSWYLAHLNNASSADFFRVQIVGPSSTTTVFTQAGSAANRAGAWATASANLSSFAGQTVRIRIEAADASTGSLIEAGVDDVKIVKA